jgi:phenylpropionate dioxygenase-like ring-hydroxylating dioxygenase large terminal subunit
VFRCPYHGWTYALDGALKGAPEFSSVCDFDRSAHGLVPIETGVWEGWVFVRLDGGGPACFTERLQTHFYDFVTQRVLNSVLLLHLAFQLNDLCDE